MFGKKRKSCQSKGALALDLVGVGISEPVFVGIKMRGFRRTAFSADLSNLTFAVKERGGRKKKI